MDQVCDDSAAIDISTKVVDLAQKEQEELTSNLSQTEQISAQLVDSAETTQAGLDSLTAEIASFKKKTIVAQSAMQVSRGKVLEEMSEAIADLDILNSTDLEAPLTKCSSVKDEYTLEKAVEEHKGVQKFIKDIEKDDDEINSLISEFNSII